MLKTLRVVVLALMLLAACFVGTTACSSTQGHARAPEHEVANGALAVARLSVRVVDDLCGTWFRSLRMPINIDVLVQDGVKRAVVQARDELEAADLEIDAGGFGTKHFAKVRELMTHAGAELAAVGAKPPSEFTRALDFLGAYVGARP